MAVTCGLLRLASCEDEPGRVDNHDEVPRVHVRCVLRLVLAPQHCGDVSRQSTDDLALGVYQAPMVFRLARFGRVSSGLLGPHNRSAYPSLNAL